MLTALYDLAASPLTFDFAYAVVQAEVERRRRFLQTLAFQIKDDKSAVGNIDFSKRNIAYAPGEPNWRLRHIIVPLSQMLPVPAELHYGNDFQQREEVFSRPLGLHWLSDVALLAENGENVQVLVARTLAKEFVAAELKERAQGRRIITITLRETRYGVVRNSNLQAWAALAREFPRDQYAVVILRDLERVSEPLPGEWGDIITFPIAVWSLHLRAALYKLAWLNLAVNNGPSAILIFNSRTRFLIFKMLEGTSETSPQHFRRLGVEPGMNFSFLRPHQTLVWSNDDLSTLCDRVFMALAELDSGLFSPPPPAASVFDCMLAAARRDYRTGNSAADTLTRLPEGPAKGAVAVEWAAMLLDENRCMEAALALQQAARSPERDALAISIAHASNDRAVVDILTPLMTGTVSGDWRAAMRRAEQFRIVETVSTQSVTPSAPLQVYVEAGSKLVEALYRVGAAEHERRRKGIGELRLIISAADDTLLSIAALFPAITSFSLYHNEAFPPQNPHPDPATAALAHGMAQVPERALFHLSYWRHTQKLTKAGYLLYALNGTEHNICAYTADLAGSSQIPVINWKPLAKIWPLEMLAALLSQAKLRIVSDPAAMALANILGLTYVTPKPE